MHTMTDGNNYVEVGSFLSFRKVVFEQKCLMCSSDGKSNNRTSKIHCERRKSLDFSW